MRNLTIEQQKEFEKMKAKINGLHQENYDLIKSYNKQLQQLHNINKNLVEEIDNLKKQNLELITENNERTAELFDKIRKPAVFVIYRHWRIGNGKSDFIRLTMEK